MNKLALGTVQFGLPYGVSNKNGQVKNVEVGKILNVAKSYNINTLDTAIAYGNSEEVIGMYSLDSFNIITKLPSVPDNVSDIEGWAEQQLTSSLERLNISRVNAVLLHQPQQLNLRMGAKLYAALQTLQNKGLTDRIGISIYDPIEFINLNQHYHFDLVQAPLNILDTRLQDSGALDGMSKAGTSLHVRSIFLQGLLLMNDRPQRFGPWSKLWKDWDEWLQLHNLTPLEACVRHVLSLSQIEKVVVGVDSSKQLKQILNAAHGSLPELSKNILCNDSKLLNPHLWSSL